jgi:hypothetical protein
MMSLEQVTAIVESGNCATAMRFEPVTFSNKPLWITRQIPTIQKGHGGSVHCDYDTALQIGCTSYGLFQMLGANIYADGYAYTIFDFGMDENAQKAMFAAFCNDGRFSSSEDVTLWDDERFIKWAIYQNGPGNTSSYVAQMHKAIGAR